MVESVALLKKQPSLAGSLLNKILAQWNILFFFLRAIILRQILVGPNISTEKPNKNKNENVGHYDG
jgi:hypothetical protein